MYSRSMPNSSYRTRLSSPTPSCNPGYHEIFITIMTNLFLDALLPQALLILGLEVGVNLGSLGRSVAVHLGLETTILDTIFIIIATFGNSPAW